MKKRGTVLYRAAKAKRTRQEILAVAADIASAEGLEGLFHREAGVGIENE